MMLRSAILILSGNATTSLLLLARNLIVARLIPMADYGIAATFAMAMAIVEMMSALGLQQQIVQARNGEDFRFQAALQGFQVLRGVALSIVLILLAGPIADFLNVPEAAWAYRVLALVPLLNALTHFDVHRLNRSMVYWPVILTGTVPALASVVAVWPLAAWYGDYRVMLWSIVVQAALTVVVSHLMAHRSYRLILDGAVWTGSLRFGWPLLMNGILLFAVFHGDKLIVGREMGMEVLAIFAMGFTLTLTPTLVMAKSAQNFFLPQLAAVDRDTVEGEAQFCHLSSITMQVSLLNGAILIIAVVFGGAILVQVVLGEKFSDLFPLLVPLALMQALRVAKSGGAVIALSCGYTSNAMLANIARVATLPLAWYAVSQGAQVISVVMIGAAGEALGYYISLYLVRRRLNISLKPLRWPILWMALFIGTTLVLPKDPLGATEFPSGQALWFLWAIALIMAVLSMVELRQSIFHRRTAK